MKRQEARVTSAGPWFLGRTWRRKLSYISANAGNVQRAGRNPDGRIDASGTFQGVGILKTEKLARHPGAKRLQALVLLAGLAWAGLVQAQQAAAPNTSAAAACLVKPTEPLKYPYADQQMRNSGSVKAKLTFSRADRAPQVEILGWSGSAAMREAAEDYLRAYRLPCLGAGEQLALEQEVVFKALGAEGDTRSSESGPWNCVRTPGEFTYSEPPHFLKRVAKGNFLLDLIFEAPDAPPKVKERYNSTPSRYRADVLSHVEQYRMPCMKPGEPVQQGHHFRYWGESNSAKVLKDMDLIAFLGAVKDVSKVPVKFELDTMSCPFQVRWRLYQPALENFVRSVGVEVPQREPFLKWLTTLTLNINKDQFEDLMGAEMVIRVPCGTIAL